MKNLLHRSDIFVTVHNKSSKISPSTSMQFATRVQRFKKLQIKTAIRR